MLDHVAYESPTEPLTERRRRVADDGRVGAGARGRRARHVKQHADFAEVVPGLGDLDQFLTAVGQFVHELELTLGYEVDQFAHRALLEQHLDFIQVEEVLRLIRELADGDRIVVVATHDARILPLADRVVELTPDFPETHKPPEAVEVKAGEVLFEQGTMGELIYFVTEGDFELIHELADGGEELVKVSGPGDYFGDIGVLFHMPRSATARARTDATVIGYTAPAFRERLGAGGISDVIKHRKLAHG